MSVSKLLRQASKLAKDGDVNGSRKIYEQILTKFPNNRDARKGLAGTQSKTKAGPPLAELQALLTLYQAKKMQKTNEQGRAMIAKYGDDYQVHNILGAVHLDTGNYLPAMGHFQKVNALAPTYPDGFNNLGAVMHNLRVPDQAITAYEKAIALKPKFAQAHSNRNFELNYTTKHSPRAIYDKHMEYEAQFGGLAIQIKHTADGVRKKRLKVGYVSPDFYAHSVAYFFEPLLAGHDAQQVETYCYYCANKVDDTTTRLRGMADHWRDVAAMTDAQLVKQIADDGIDILVDLAGHSAKSRIQVFARKPAPVQVAWLGYPNTTGLNAVDYRFTDVVADPVGEADECHSEELIRLDGGIWCYRGGMDCPEVVVKGDRVVTFGSFNHMSKLSPQVIALWSKVLKSVKNSKLLLKHLELGHAVTRDTVVKQFAAHGIGNDRLELHGKLPKYADHLALYGQVDIGLDPFPFNGCTTTFEALWMGVPVIALRGDTHVARVGASILTHLGHPELVAQDEGDFIRIAAELAANKMRRVAFRTGLRDTIKASPLGDADAFARKVEVAYAEMWYRFAQTGQQK
tara:strand:- start:43099 stop:44811 length:1713 start_codon:yes stop_codon:yes gene_type:complete